MRYDLIVLGDEADGLDGALEAAYLKKRVAIVAIREASDESSDAPSRERFRPTAIRLAGIRTQEIAVDRKARGGRTNFSDLRMLTRKLELTSSALVVEQFCKFGVDYFVGTARLTGSNSVEINSATNESQILYGDNLLISVGARSVRPSWIPFDGEVILDSDEVLSLARVPKSMIVIGGGRVALECATTFALLGTRVAVVDSGKRVLELYDRGVIRVFRKQAIEHGVRFRLGQSINGIEKTSDDRVAVRLECGTSLLAQCVVYASGQIGQTDSLNLVAAGLETDEQGRLWCNEHGQTWVKHIYGAGEVIGFPASAGESTGQGLRAVRHAFERPTDDALPAPHILMTAPALAKVGATEQELRDNLVAYGVGIARFREVSHGQIGGTASGLLKLLFHRESLELLGVHCLGKSAPELIRIGQTVMSMNGTIEAFQNETFPHAELSECYRRAASDGLRRLEAEFESSESTHRTWRPRSQRRGLTKSSF